MPQSTTNTDYTGLYLCFVVLTCYFFQDITGSPRRCANGIHCSCVAMRYDAMLPKEANETEVMHQGLLRHSCEGGGGFAGSSLPLCGLWTQFSAT
jgi:hypothetical protein